MRDSERRLEQAVLNRLQVASGQISHSLRCVARGNPLAAEEDTTRLKARLRAKAELTPYEAEVAARGIHGAEPPDVEAEAPAPVGPERI